MESELRVEDSIFRMTRERAMLLLADVDKPQAKSIVDRLVMGFRERFPTASGPGLSLAYYEVLPGCGELLAKDVLPSVFPSTQSRDA